MMRSWAKVSNRMRMLQIYNTHERNNKQWNSRGLRSSVMILQQGLVTARHKVKTATSPYLGNEHPLQRRRQSSKGQGQGERGGDSWCWRSSIAVCCWCFVKFSVFVLWGKRMRKDWDQSSSCYIASYPALTEYSLLFGTRDVDNNMRRMRVDSRLFV